MQPLLSGSTFRATSLTGQGIAANSARSRRVGGLGSSRCCLPMPALGKVSAHLASASKPAVTTPSSAAPIIFLQESSVTSGSLSPSKCSLALAQIHQVSLLKREWPPWPELHKCTYPTVAMETMNYGLLVSSQPAPLGQQAHTTAMPTR